MKYLLDTDSVSFALRGQGEVGARLRDQRPSDVGISALTLAELRYGAERKGSRRLHRLIDAFAGAVEVMPFDDAAAAEFGRLGSLLAARGTPIGEFDALIAAHAVALRCTLVTNNVRHFSRVPGLVVENWA
ncbi:MAG TPA: type II toxin-antitoxin system VapC family toxin [Polyangia bacterium]|nr:type II toxin-antitoxin system VapC family toxin [Polyangia bacterium]